ncbi:Beta-galactosidase 8 [Citrus sinensis]|uniref:beta-galactosidase 8-like n=1 Tax=Citrus sinensis TaxID=2711 RepID=UPI00219557D4|nr:beta-galactosidase 8-like [Citrus sinensis]KAH9748485.1 Beta-galactosidase 8 [Citrus sinensis]
MGMIKNFIACVLLVVLFLQNSCFEAELSANVTYDHRALVIDGKRRVLQSGSIHYPRSTPEVWPELIRKSKEGGLEVIETYVFWNYHEPIRGQYYFEGRFDLVRFVKTVQEAGLFLHLRIGPYACAEWNYGGFPVWLHFIPGIQFRKTNNPFKEEMKRFLAKIVDLMKQENLFASQGGPIILAQVENEYGNVEWAYGVGGELYVKWAADTAVNLNTSVPWVMCQQEDAPDPIINTCNGFYCDGFTPNSPSKPIMWTENYSGWFLSFGYAVPFRPVEDLAFAVARFFETGGTFQNYYMYFGGTNFGRTAGGPLVATSYDYDAPIDEYGFIRQPKWGHLRELHKAIKLCEEYLISSDPTHQKLGAKLEAHIYHKSSNDCAAFLANYDSSSDANVTFNGNVYFLPAWSVSILPDCKNVVFNTAKVISQRNIGDHPFAQQKNVNELLLASSAFSWYEEKVGISGNRSFVRPDLAEQINTTKDTSDYLWYTASIHVMPGQGKEVFLNIESLGHAALVFVNKKLVAFGYGNHDFANFSINKKIELNEGINTLDILSMMVGLQNYGAWFDVAGAGLFSVILIDLKNGKRDLSSGEWIYQVGVEGEYIGLDKISLANSSFWKQGSTLPVNKSLIWYKTTFLAPEGKGPLALNLASMGKGQAWVNGQSIGRYWSAYLAPSTGCTKKCDYRGSYDASKCQKHCGQPAQTLYHIPRTWVHPGENLLVIHEELGGDPSKISLLTKTGQDICSFVSEADPPPVDSWKPNLGVVSSSPQVRLACERGWHIAAINFASYGIPEGNCGSFRPGACHMDVLPIVQKACVGQIECSIPVSSAYLGVSAGACPGLLKALAVEAHCSI